MLPVHETEAIPSEEGIGRVDGDEMPQIIGRIQGENEHA